MPNPLVSNVFAMCTLAAAIAGCSPVAQEQPKSVAVPSEKRGLQKPATAKPMATSAATSQESGEDRVGGGCREAQESYEKHCLSAPEDCDHKGADIHSKAYGDILNHGTYLNSCGAPASMAVSVCAAVIDGRAKGVTVSTTPHDSEVGSCIARAVSEMSFPVSPKLDITNTSFAAQ